jgi:hypothetical protein
MFYENKIAQKASLKCTNYHPITYVINYPISSYETELKLRNETWKDTRGKNNILPL